jgi:putative membrane protein
MLIMLLNNRIPVRYILNKVKVELVYVLLVSLIMLFVTTKFHRLLPEMPLTIPTFIGTAISILLSFKLNQAYDLWWEARKVWGSIVNDSRSFVIQFQTMVSSGNDERIKKMAHRQIAWCYSLGQSLRGLPPTENLESLLTPDELAAMEKHTNKPLALLQFHGRDLKYLKENQQPDAYSHVQLDNTLVRLCDAQGKSERIKGTVFPVTYRLFLHAIIYLFVVTLSIALKDVAVYFDIPLLLLISAAFFLLERSATHMQDPFENRPTDTAMTSIARTIEINIRQLLSEPTVPQPYPANVYYQL